MIPRYSRPEMAAIWEADNRFRTWFEIEAHACDAQAELGVIPKAAAEAVRERGKFEAARIDEIEKQTKHDVIAFLTNLAEHVGPEARFVHQGMTSSDVSDTCLAVQLAQAFWRRSSAAPLNSATPLAWAAATASTPSPPPSA